MTGQTSILSTLQSSHFCHVTLTYEFNASVVGCSVVNVNLNISLIKVLCLPNFPFNLLSINQSWSMLIIMLFPFFLTIVFFIIFWRKGFLIGGMNQVACIALKKKSLNHLLLLLLSHHISYIVIWVICLYPPYKIMS